MHKHVCICVEVYNYYDGDFSYFIFIKETHFEAINHMYLCVGRFLCAQHIMYMFHFQYIVLPSLGQGCSWYMFSMRVHQLHLVHSRSTVCLFTR